MAATLDRACAIAAPWGYVDNTNAPESLRTLKRNCSPRPTLPRHWQLSLRADSRLGRRRRGERPGGGKAKSGGVNCRVGQVRCSGRRPTISLVRFRVGLRSLRSLVPPYAIAP